MYKSDRKNDKPIVPWYKAGRHILLFVGRSVVYEQVPAILFYMSRTPVIVFTRLFFKQPQIPISNRY